MLEVWSNLEMATLNALRFALNRDISGFEAKRTKSTLTCTPTFMCKPKRKNTMFLFVPTISVVSSFLYLRNKVTISNRDDYYQFFSCIFFLVQSARCFDVFIVRSYKNGSILDNPNNIFFRSKSIWKRLNYFLVKCLLIRKRIPRRRYFFQNLKQFVYCNIASLTREDRL